ncbi:MAG: hypothetical protein Q9219_006789 [cf. Caloplaca sp. 3 TL-2023]
MEEKDLTDIVKNARKKVKLHPSFDSAYWMNSKRLAEKEFALNTLKKKNSMKTTDVTADQWAQSGEAQKLFLIEKSIETNHRFASEQLARSQEFEEKCGFQKGYADLFIGSPLGWGFKNSRGERDSDLQQALRADLILRQESQHPDPAIESLWCPITKEYLTQTALVAGHLFPWNAGPLAMEAIFGISQEYPAEENASEPFRAENGILWVQEAEERFTAGHFCIVPDVPAEPTSEEIAAWEALEVKEYRIRVLDSQNEKMKKKIGTTDKIWADLDNEHVAFKGKFRPRARYLYFAYCQAMLRMAYGGKHTYVAKVERGKKFWGTPGRYVLKSMLRGFIEAMGDDYSHILEGGLESAEEDKGETDVRGVMLANEDIQQCLEEKEDEVSSDDDDNSDNGEVEEE